MDCQHCGGTGWALEYDETAGPGYVDIECPECHGVDGNQPDWMDELMDICTQAEIDEAWVRRHRELVTEGLE